MVFIYEKWKVVLTPFALSGGREVSHRLLEGEGASSYQDAFRSGKGSHQLALTIDYI